MNAFARLSEAEKMTLTVAGAIVFGYAFSLASKYFAYAWIVDAHGRPVLEDFAAFYAAGRSALHGAALSAYDPHAQHLAEVAVAGHEYDGALGWSYPPLFLFAAAALASFSYGVAFLTWIAVTFVCYASVTAMIAQRRLAFLVAAAAPWVVTAMLPGQNGFLTASLVGLVLLNLERRPGLAGLCLGLLTYKPQFGILFPFALAAGGYWRAFAWAAASALAANELAAAVFGVGTLTAFLHMLFGAAQSHLATNGLGWNKLLSVYGLVHALGGTGAVALLAQVGADIALAATIVTCWRARISYPLKAALLAASLPLATPYVLIYDLPTLAIALAFLFRDRGFDRTELALMICATPFLYPFPAIGLPLPIIGSFIVFAMAARRIYNARPRTRINPSWATDATSLPSLE